MKCSVDGCDTSIPLRKGLCIKHYMRMHRHGSTDFGTLHERFWRHCRKAVGCWEWAGTIDARGYGILSVGRKNRTAHRISYEMNVGPVPDGLDLDHLCRNRACVNPSHLEAVSRKENVLRGEGAPAQNRRKTHCKHGHPFAGANLDTSEGRRRCVTCRKATQARQRGRAKSFVLAAVALFLFAGSASAFPELSRLGYASCTSCHVSPTGGGTLTRYGRSMTQELSTWAADGEGDVGHGFAPQMPDQILIGGDLRSMSLRGPGLRMDFPMQDDVEAAIEPIPHLWLVGSVGLYGPDHRRQYRRQYAMINLTDGLTVRAGRFFPAYGIQFADHTIATREALGWGEGMESYNGEVSYRGKWGEVFLTQVVGTTGTIDIPRDDVPVYGTRTETAMIGRASLFLGDTSQIGVSSMVAQNPYQSRTVFGVYSMSSPWAGVYSLSELDRQCKQGEQPQTIGTQILGWEFWKGAHVQASGEMVTDQDDVYGLALDWFPRPHLEFLLKYKQQADIPTGMFMAHYYL